MTERDEGVASNPRTAFEPSDLSMRVVAAIALGILLYVCLAPFVLTRIYRAALGDVSRTLDIKPPAPVLQLDPAADLGKFDAKETTQLNSYGWVDQAHGIARIPIDQAMKDLAARGIPDFGKPAP